MTTETVDFAGTGDGLRIAYVRAGEGAPVLLLHGFASSAEQNWRSTGWFRILTEAGRSVIAPDFRGHGMSDKPHDPERYGVRMLADILAVLDAAAVGPVDVLGYSMGASLCLHLLAAHPARVRRAVAAGIGERPAPLPREDIARALEHADGGSAGANPAIESFRHFATQKGKDPLALAACMRALPERPESAQLRRISHPVLVACGACDAVAGDPAPLAAALPDGRALRLAGRDHMTAVGDPALKRAVRAFFFRGGAPVSG